MVELASLIGKRSSCAVPSSPVYQAANGQYCREYQGTVTVNGRVQPTLEELESKKTFLEDNSQYPRKVMI